MPSTADIMHSLPETAATAAAEEDSSGDRAARQQPAAETTAPESKDHHHAHASFWDQLINIAGNNKINSLSDLIRSTAAVELMIEHNEIPL